MIRKIFKKKTKKHNKINDFLKKYNIPKGHFSINRHTVTRGLSVGLFFAFIPMPMQMLAVIATGSLVRFNIPIAISMVWLSNPITMPFMYYIEYLTGIFLLGQKEITNITLSIDWFSNNINDIFIPLYLGALTYSFIISITTYYTINHLWKISVQKAIQNKKSNN